MKDTILFGDCETLSEFAPQSARTCVTSHHTTVRDYGTATWIGSDPNKIVSFIVLKLIQNPRPVHLVSALTLKG